MAKEFLSRRGVPFVEKDVSKDRAAAYEMIRRSGQQGVPQIQVGEEIVVGFNRPRLEQLLAQHAAPPARGVSLGVRVADASRHAPDAGRGAYVGDVKPGSVGARLGLRSGDVITAVNGRSVDTADDLIRLTGELTPGKPIRLAVRRDGRSEELTVAA